jgi:hypothetical protein
MELATEPLSERAPKANSPGAWSEFLRRVLVPRGLDDGAEGAADAAIVTRSELDAGSGLREGVPAE